MREIKLYRKSDEMLFIFLFLWKKLGKIMQRLYFKKDMCFKYQDCLSKGFYEICMNSKWLWDVEKLLGIFVYKVVCN